MIEHHVFLAAARTPRVPTPAIRAMLEAAARTREIVRRMDSVYGPYPIDRKTNPSLWAAYNFSSELSGFEEEK